MRNAKFGSYFLLLLFKLQRVIFRSVVTWSSRSLYRSVEAPGSIIGLPTIRRGLPQQGCLLYVAAWHMHKGHLPKRRDLEQQDPLPKCRGSWQHNRVTYYATTTGLTAMRSGLALQGPLLYVERPTIYRSVVARQSRVIYRSVMTSFLLPPAPHQRCTITSSTEAW